MHPLTSLNLDRSKVATSGNSSECRLKLDGTSSRSIVLSSLDLHSIMICQQQSSRCFSKLVPSDTTLVTTIAPLHCVYSILENVVLFSLFKTTQPALDQGSARCLMEYAMRLKGIMRGLSHKYFRNTELDVSLGKRHGNGLMLHSPDFLEFRNPWFFRVHWLVFIAFAFSKTLLNKFDTKLLSILTIHTPWKYLVGNSWKEHAVSVKELTMNHTNRITGTSNSDGFKNTTIS
mmetsp:Transcript_29063/g.84178  ORF Transcript_29063/g.84178 Transcript_29063/m.84178 type:complete len:232 (-) Transcript_29063:775-1470(-)